MAITMMSESPSPCPGIRRGYDIEHRDGAPFPFRINLNQRQILWDKVFPRHTLDLCRSYIQKTLNFGVIQIRIFQNDRIIAHGVGAALCALAIQNKIAQNLISGPLHILARNRSILQPVKHSVHLRLPCAGVYPEFMTAKMKKRLGSSVKFPSLSTCIAIS